MARKKKSEGAEVRAAFDGPTVEYDTLISTIFKHNQGDSERASDAGEARQAIGAFLDETNLNNKAYSVLRQILKTKKTDKAMDMIRSLEHGLPMVKTYLSGNQPDMLDQADDEPEVEPADEDDLPGPSYAPDDIFADEVEPDAELEADQDDFDAHLAEVQAAE